MRSSLVLVLAALAALPSWADEPAASADAKRLFALGDDAFTSEREPMTLARAVPGITAERVRFPSAVTTAVERNNTVHGIYFTPRKPTDRAVILLPWFKDHDTSNVELIGQAYAAAGFNVLFIAMGYQFQRAPEGKGSGDYIVQNSAAHVQEWIRQAVLDTRRAHRWLVTEAKNDPKKIGVTGISLGGFIAGLSYGVAPELKASNVILAGGNLGPYVQLGARLGISQITEALDRMHIAADDLPALLAPYDPVTYADPARKDGLLIVCGFLDPVVPYPIAKELWTAYGQPHMLRLPTGHVTSVAMIPLVLATSIAHFNRQLR